MSNEISETLQRIERKVDVVCALVRRGEKTLLSLLKKTATIHTTDGEFRRDLRARVRELRQIVADFVQRTK